MSNICFECGGTLEMKGGKGRTFTYCKGRDHTLPEGFLMPTCRECGEVFVDPETEKRAKEALRNYA